MDPSVLPALVGSSALSAAAGLNPWIPLLGVGIAARTGIVELSDSFNWLGTNPSLAVLAVLFVLDLVGDKVALLDHVLHLGGLVVAPASGAVVLAAQQELADQVPWWLLVTVGMALAEVFQLGRSTARPLVSVSTGGAGNPVASLLEDLASLTLTVLAVLVPLLAAAAGTTTAVLAARWLWRRRQRRGSRPPENTPPAPVAP